MEVYLNVSWSTTLSDGERFRVTGKSYSGAPVRTIEVAMVKFRRYLGGRLELSGPVIKKDGTPGERDSRVEVDFDDDVVPQRVRDEVNRMCRLQEQFVADAKGALS